MTFADRVRGTLALQPAVFEEIEANPDINLQALAIVVASSLATGIGVGVLDVLATVQAAGSALVMWIEWSAVTYLVGTRLLPEPQTQSNMGELLRVIGFSSSPSLFAVLGIVPLVGWLAWPVIGVWVFAATVMAVRQALDYRSTVRALGVVLVSWVIVLGLGWVIVRLSGGLIA